MSGNDQDRRNWTRSLTLVLVVAVVAIVLSYMVDAGAQKTDRLYLKNSAGPVLFDHGKHSELDDSCIKCHHNVTTDTEPGSCRECHPAVQASETSTVTCITCHEDGYTADMMEHEEYLEIAEHSCLGCHTPRSVSEAYHTSCSACHLETARERFTIANGELQCGACHLR